MASGVTVAVVGATGAAGSTTLRILEERKFPVRELRAFASERSVGKTVTFKGDGVKVQRIEASAFKGVDIAICAAGTAQSREYSPMIARAGAVVVDKSNAFRMDPKVPLVVPEINAHAVRHSLAAKRITEAETDDVLQEIIAASNRAGDVIRRLRTWLTRDQPALQALEVNQVVTDVERLLHSELIMRHVNLRLHLRKDLPAVSADRVQLQQVILNLALNGIEAMQDRPVSARHLTIATSLANRGVLVSVRDRGTGIHPDHMDRLFDPFFSTKPTGLGVGLRICWSIVTGYGGRIWAENNADAGATFFFTLQPAAEFV